VSADCVIPTDMTTRFLLNLCLFFPLLAATAQESSPGLTRFQELDANGNGKLEPSEMEGRSGLFHMMDTDGDQLVTQAEAIAFVKSRNAQKPNAKTEPLVATLEIPAEAPVSESSCQAAADYSANRNGYSLLVSWKGQTIYERYDNGWSPDKPYRLASGTKSFSGIMAAAAVQDGLIESFDEPIAGTITEWQDDPRRSKITLGQLLSLTSGLDAGKVGGVPSYQEVVKTPAKQEPGTRFSYGPNPYQVFGEFMRRKLVAQGDYADPLEYLDARIFQPIGLDYGDQWRRDEDGMPHLPSGAFLTAREWVKFGEFLKRGGEVDGKPLLDPEALKQCWKANAVNPAYGITFWRLARPGRDLPELLQGTVMASGAGKQRLYILPKADLVVVRQGETKGKYGDEAILTRLLGLSPEG